MSSENKEYSVNWKNHMSHVRKAFDNLLTSNELTDVTLSCEGRKIGAHKMLLSACSTYFRDTFKDVPSPHPVIILYGVEYSVLSDILHFIYNGEVSVDTSKLDSFLKVAQLLQISGLTDGPINRVQNVNENAENTESESRIEQTYTEVPPASSGESRKVAKRPRINEAEASKEKIQRQDCDTLFISDVKCEPSELVHFEDPLAEEDPLLQADQPHDTKIFIATGTGQNSGEEEFKIEVQENKIRFGEETQPVQKFSPRNTVRSRSCIWKSFKNFCRQRKYTLNESTPTEKISEVLADWGSNMRKNNGTDYKEAAVKTIWNTTAKMLQEMFYEKYKIKFDPFRDVDFKKARDSRDSKRRQLKISSEKRKFRPITLNERQKIYSLCDEDTPAGLQRKFYHLACFELGWKAREAVNCLRHYFREERDESGAFTGRIEYNPMLESSDQESSSCQSKWLVANDNDPNICPVRLLCKLLDKVTTNSNIKSNRLFLTRNPYWNKSGNSAWYKDSPVGYNQIVSWNKEAFAKIGFDTKQVKVIDNPSTSKTF